MPSYTTRYHRYIYQIQKLICGKLAVGGNHTTPRNRMDCLVKGMGLIEAEYFVSVIMREKFDYTKCQREYFDRIPADQLDREASAYEKQHPYSGNAQVVIE